MGDTRKGITCEYCGAAFTLRYDSDELKPAFCAFCSEAIEAPTVELEDEEDDYPEDENELS